MDIVEAFLVVDPFTAGIINLKLEIRRNLTRLCRREIGPNYLAVWILVCEISAFCTIVRIEQGAEL